MGEGNYVVKSDGLCGGKGVKVAGAHLASIDEAVAYCKECLPKFVLCEKLSGEEFSVLSFCDGTHLAHMPAVQDHKRAYEGDAGPNTGGKTVLLERVQPQPCQVLAAVQPKRGRLLLFPHVCPHRADEVLAEGLPKLLLRGEVV